MSSALDIVKTIAPFIGTALGGPLGGGVATWIAGKLGMSDSSVTAISSAITTMTGNPEMVVKLKELETEYRTKQLEAGITLAQLEAQVTVAVNTTMQAEARADHWPTYSWRPFIGFQLGLYILAQWMLPLFSIAAPKVDPELMLVIGGILGVASYFRGKAQADPNIPTDNRG